MQSNNRTNRTQRTFSNLFGLLVCFSMLFTSIAAAPAPKQIQPGTAANSSSQSGTPVQAAAAPAAPADPSHVNFRQLVIKLKPTQGGLQANAIGGPSIQNTLPAAQIKPLFPEAEQSLPNMTASAADPASGYTPRLDLYLQANLDQSTTFDEAQKLLDAVQQNPAVDVAYMEPVYLPASPLRADTIDLTASQTYRGVPPGINADYAFNTPGGKGTGVNLIDIEAGWQIGHEDLNITSSSLLDDSTSASDLDLVNHGTAVLGVIAARDNNMGVLGLAPATTVRMISTFSYSPAEAITKAASHLNAGDIIVLPIQAFGPESDDPDLCTPPSPAFGSIPIEYWQANFDAISAATLKGIIVVEAAGNGAVNLDHTRYDNKFKLSSRDSGAILVSAGTSDTHEPLCDSNFGSRVDVQGWGENVATTGYGDLAQGLDADGNPDPNRTYTAIFGGSSAATALIAGSVASLQGIAKNRGYNLTPYLTRSLLHSTATPQGGSDVATHKIGPLPDLKRAIDTRLTNGVLTVSPLVGEVLYTLRPTLVWQNYLNASQYWVQVASDSDFRSLVVDARTYNTEYTLPTNIATRTYYWRVTAMVSSVWKPWSHDELYFQVAGSGAPDVFPTAPLSGTQSDNYTPTLTWKLKTATTTPPSGYYIDVSTSYDFSDGTTYQVADGSTFSYTVAALTHNSRYFWRIRSYINNTSNPAKPYLGGWSGRVIYYTTLDITAIQPANMVFATDTYENTLRPTLDWPDITDAKYYEVQVASNNFTTVILKATVSRPTSADLLPSSYRFTTDMPRGKSLYWRVRARGTWGFSVWSPVQSFIAANPPAIPAPKTPALRQVASTWQDGVSFTWLRPTVPVTIPQPDSYEIQAATNRDFTEGLITDTPSDDPVQALQTTTLTGFEPEAVYYWRVRAVSSTGTSNWSGAVYFYTTPPKPENPTTLKEDSLRPTLGWDPVSIARSYQVQVALNDLFTTGVKTVSTSTIPPYDLSITLPRSTSVYWRVRAGGLYGYSGWSDTVNIALTPNSPNTPVLKSPATYTNLKNYSPTLDWYDSAAVANNPDASAVGYEVDIFTNPADITGSRMVGSPFSVTESTYVVPADLFTQGDTYYWRVRAVNAAAEYSPWSSIFAFVTPAMVSGKIVDVLADPTTGLPDIMVQVDGRAIQVKTDPDGNYVIRGLTPGSYSITASPSGFARQTFTFSVGYGSNVIRDFKLVKLPDPDQYRIILSWMKTPFDLDAHLWLPTSSTPAYHIFKDATGDITTIRAEMNFSTTGDFGPEVITVGTPLFGGSYQFAVYMNADPKTFINTGARVSVYKGSTLKATYYVPTTGVGHWWKVFRIDGNADKLITQNVITDLNPAPIIP